MPCIIDIIKATGAQVVNLPMCFFDADGSQKLHVRAHFEVARPSRRCVYLQLQGVQAHRQRRRHTVRRLHRLPVLAGVPLRLRRLRRGRATAGRRRDRRMITAGPISLSALRYLRGGLQLYTTTVHTTQATHTTHTHTLGSYGKKLVVSVNQQKILLSVWGS